jgi:hypothetical protein
MENSSFTLSEVEAPCVNDMAIMSFNASMTADKFSLTSLKATEILSLHSRRKSDKSEDLSDLLHSKIDGLLGFMLTTFRPTASFDSVTDAMDKPITANGLNPFDLAAIDEGAIPVAIVRTLAKCRVDFDHHKLRNWSPFATRYAAQLLA